MRQGVGRTQVHPTFLALFLVREAERAVAVVIETGVFGLFTRRLAAAVAGLLRSLSAFSLHFSGVPVGDRALVANFQHSLLLDQFF